MIIFVVFSQRVEHSESINVPSCLCPANELQIDLPIFLGSLVAFACGFFLVLTKKWHGRFSFDLSTGVQRFHVMPTPRIGGIAIFLGFVAAYLSASGNVSDLLDDLLLASLPAFVVGLIEDVTKRVSVRDRLVATMLSAAVACYLTEHRITSLGFEPLDSYLQFPIVSLLLTVFAVAGIANAINIIDGFNGLAAGTVIIALIAIGQIAFGVGDTGLGEAAWISAGAIFGFFVVNFPFGKIFMGDGGAYLLGFLLAWFAVLLPERNPEVSPWASLMICSYPVIEVLYSIFRRRKKRYSPGQPDSLHLHSLIKSNIIRPLFPKVDPVFRNSLVSPICWSLTVFNSIVAFWFQFNTGFLVISFFGAIFCYHVIYRSVKKFQF